jgi:hypothetical protein
MKKGKFFVATATVVLAVAGAFASKASGKFTGPLGYVYTSPGGQCVAYTAQCSGGSLATFTNIDCKGARPIFTAKEDDFTCSSNQLHVRLNP